MKRKTTILLLLLVCPVLLADLIKLTWDINDPAEKVTGYNVYEKVGTNWVRVGSTTNKLYILDVVPGAHLFAVTATNFWGKESPFSEAAGTPPLSQPPAGLKVEKDTSK